MPFDWYVIDQFLNHPDEMRQSMGEDLSQLQKLRNQADYRDVFNGFERAAKLSLLRVNSIVAQLEKL